MHHQLNFPGIVPQSSQLSHQSTRISPVAVPEIVACPTHQTMPRST